MLELYFKSIVIYIIVICCASVICGTKIKKNGWTTDVDILGSGIEGFINLCCISAVPIARFFAVLGMFVMAFYTQEQLEELRKQLEEYDEPVEQDCDDDN